MSPGSAVRKIKISITLDAEAVEELRARAGTRGFSAAINAAVRKEVERLRREQALDRWLSELEDEEGPVSPDVIRRWEQEWQL